VWPLQLANLRAYPLLLIPLLAGAVQPVLNALLTGSGQAAGGAAKSILSSIPHDWGLIFQRVIANFISMWSEFFSGYNAREGWYLPFLLSLLVLIGWGLLLRRPQTRWTALLMAAWLLLLTGAISTLDTAFWHFKRYQAPAMALLFFL